MLLYIIRHGDPDYANDCLTYKGKQQADAVSKRLAANGLDEIYASPLGRAVQTAEPTAGLLNLSINIEEWMSESLAWKDLSVIREDGEQTWVFNCQDIGYLADGKGLGPDWHRHPRIACCPTAKEGYERIQLASDDFLERLGYRREGNVYRILKPSGKRIAAFCHAGFGLTWLSHLLSVPPLMFWGSFDMSHSGVTILSFQNNENGLTSPKCLVFSDLSHIYGARLPMQYNNDIGI
jgi:probable phosphoglycerate mutase